MSIRDQDEPTPGLNRHQQSTVHLAGCDADVAGLRVAYGVGQPLLDDGQYVSGTRGRQFGRIGQIGLH